MSLYIKSLAFQRSSPHIADTAGALPGQVEGGSHDAAHALHVTAERLRECLARMGWSQRGLAEMLGCDDRLVRRWASGETLVPWEVGSWLEALAKFHERNPVPTLWRRRAVSDKAEVIDTMNPNGIWAAHYAGIAGTGAITFILRDGIVAGIDVSSGLATGTFRQDPRTRRLRFNLKYGPTQPGFWAVQTGQPMQVGQHFEIDSELPEDLGGGAPVTVNTSLGPVQASFRKVAELPA